MTKRFGKIARQGDVLFIKVDSVPKNATKPCESNDKYWIIAHSETGHHHVIEKSRAEVYEAADDAFTFWIKSLADGAEAEHLRSFDTHETIGFEPNSIYRGHRQREWSPEGWRQAAD